MVWVKAFHIIFMVAWFAGLFYLPRLFVNYAETEEAAVRERLLLMARRLYRFIMPWMGLTIIFGLWLTFAYAWSAYAHSMGWFHLKLALVAVLVGYHLYCGKLLRNLEAGQPPRTATWYRWFNEFPVIILFTVVILAVVKPF